MDTQSYVIIGTLLTVIVGGIEILKKIIELKFFKKNGRENMGATTKFINNPINFQELEKMIKNTNDIISHKDTDFDIPSCYFPRESLRLQEKTLDKLDVIIGLLAKR